MRKKSIWLMGLLALVLVFSGCSKNNNGSAATSPAASGAASTAPVSSSASASAAETSAKVTDKTFTMLTDSNPSWPYSKDWPVWKWIEEKTGAKFDVQLPSGTLYDALNLTFASGTLPDLIFMPDRTQAMKYGQQGALANILDYKDKMPNFQKWMEQYPDVAKSFLAADGKMYMLPTEGFGETNRVVWMYREDIFKKNNLTPPKTYDELYDVAKKLKALYPDSYPIVFRNGMNAMINFASNFETNAAYYKNDAGDVKFGPSEDNYKTMVGYMNKFYKEKLIPADWLTLQTKQWQDLLSTSQSFITVDYIGRIDFFNAALRQENPEFTMAFMPPPAGLPGGKQQNPYTQIVENNLAIAASSKNIDDIVKVFDYYYSEEGRTLLSWGKEGETYTIENGQKKIKPDYADSSDLRKKTGLATNGTYTWIDYDAHLSLASKELKYAYEEARNYDSKFNPKPSFTDSEYETITIAGAAIDKYRDEQISKFILGSQSMGDWSKYIDGLGKLDLPKVTDLYKTALERTAQISLK
ncbi:extracellular solute-binding protein [Cohnella sp. 56]|uniref:extracellular solute-binding protein n=1 Tax=Cohnella sp. 56 TaxID=3113722 RepID=UPI0030E8B7D3